MHRIQLDGKVVDLPILAFVWPTSHNHSMDDDDKTYCAAPFRHLSYNPDGTVQPCCDWLGPTIKVDPSIENPMLTPWMDEFRHGLATGVEYSGCRVCRENEKAGAQSARNWMNQVYGKPTDIKIQWVEFNLGCLLYTSDAADE